MKVHNLKTVYKITGVPAKIIYRRKTVDFGTFTIRVKKKRRNVDLYIDVNVKREVAGFQGDTIHPHVNNEGSVCFGEHDDFIYNLMDAGEYAEVGDFVVRLLNSYNAGNGYWEVADYCLKCFELTEECECKK